MKPYYEDDAVTLYHGDCLEITEWLAADVLITDPPYGMAYRSNQGQTKHDAIAGDASTAARDAVLSAWGPRPWVMFGTWRVDRPASCSQVLIWNKAGAGFMGNTQSQFGTSHEEIYLGGEWPRRSTRRGSVINDHRVTERLNRRHRAPDSKA